MEWLVKMRCESPVSASNLESGSPLPKSRPVAFISPHRNHDSHACSMGSVFLTNGAIASLPSGSPVGYLVDPPAF